MEVADDSKKGDGGGDSPNMGAGAAEVGMGKKGINFEKITSVIIGLKTYEANITDQKLKTYI